MSIAKSVMRSFYRKAEGKPERLPWHRESPSRVLVSAVLLAPDERARSTTGAELAMLARRREWLDVTGIDIFPKRSHGPIARRPGRPETEVTGDLGRTHQRAVRSCRLGLALLGESALYKDRLLDCSCREARSCLSTGGNAMPRLAPDRASPALPDDDREAVAPELQLIETDLTDFAAPLPFGPTVRGVGYSFRRGSR